ncbi:MAG: hypothetical protein WBF56_10175 [Candidatus Acidiferrales bacterium]
MKNIRGTILTASLLAALTLAVSAPLRAGGLEVPSEVRRALDSIYAGDPGAAIPAARTLQQAQPDKPLGFALEGEALWWKRYCADYEIKYGIADSWKRGKKPEDEAYLALASKVTRLAEAQIAKSDTAEMHFYAGLGWMLKARVYALRGENRNVARAGVSAHAQMLRALDLDPQMADAAAALGIYNYYVDTLSPLVKLLRFFMGIPAGDKVKGVRQMETGMNHGALLDVDVRFVLARALRQYDQKYQEAFTIAQPLVARYPHSPMFLLLLGNINVEMGHADQAAEYFHAILDLPPPPASSPCSPCPDCPSCDADPCLTRARELAKAFLTANR